MSTNTKIAIALSVCIPVIVLANVIVCVWVFRRRRSHNEPPQEEAPRSFSVNSVHRMVNVEDLEANAGSNRVTEGSFDYGNTYKPEEAYWDANSIQTPADVTPIRNPIHEQTSRVHIVVNDCSRYSDKQLAPDRTFPEVVSGPRSCERPSSTPIEAQSIPPRTPVSPEKKKARLTAEEIIGLDTQSFLQDLPAYNGQCQFQF